MRTPVGGQMIADNDVDDDQVRDAGTINSYENRIPGYFNVPALNCY